MNYELALKLKEAGYPQNHKWVNECKTFGCWLKDGIGRKEDIHSPSLEELIEALPKGEDFALFSIGDKWRADFKSPNNMVMLGEVEGEYRAVGSTPLEAVANLWLKLNKR